jgi:hypothetical protein
MYHVEIKDLCFFSDGWARDPEHKRLPIAKFDRLTAMSMANCALCGVSLAHGSFYKPQKYDTHCIELFGVRQRLA